MTFEQAQQLLSKGREGRKKVDNNTYLYEVREGIAVQLHSTNVVVIRPDNTYILNSGGWRTVTTKDRINKYSPARLFQSKGFWFVGTTPFFDGMVVNQDGIPLTPSSKV